MASTCGMQSIHQHTVEKFLLDGCFFLVAAILVHHRFSIWEVAREPKTKELATTKTKKDGLSLQGIVLPAMWQNYGKYIHLSK